MIIHSFTLGPVATNCWVLAEKDLGQAVIVDPGLNPTPVLDYLARFRYRATHVLLTHLHADHAAGTTDIAAATGAEVLASDADLALGDDPLLRGGAWGFPSLPPLAFTPVQPQRLTLLGQPCLPIPVPGHSPGSLCWYFPAVAAIFTGDTLFKNTVGRTDHALGDGAQLLHGIRTRLLTLPDDTEVYPGHGQPTTIGAEKTANPFFSEIKVFSEIKES